VSAGSWYHCRVKPISRSAGRSVVAAAAYRLGDRLHDVSGEIHDYRRRSGVESAFGVAPDRAQWARQAEALWNAAELRETRRNSTLARECELALPAVVGKEERAGIAWGFARELTTRYGVASSVAIHRPGRGSDKNFHAHILFTTRRVGVDGLGEKTRELDARATGPQEIAYLREYAADLINASLERSGSDERVDHRSFDARGIDREATVHVGVIASAMERRGRDSERGERNRETEAHNAQLAELVDELAALDAEIAREQQRRLDVGHLEHGQSADASDRQEARFAAFEDYLSPTIAAVEQTGETSSGAGWWENIKTALAHMAHGVRETWRSHFEERE
jgi:ATP-dependent exoDNAse (exonuclease V) alpha subunit